jgi:hypothetical protein
MFTFGTFELHDRTEPYMWPVECGCNGLESCLRRELVLGPGSWHAVAAPVKVPAEEAETASEVGITLNLDTVKVLFDMPLRVAAKQLGIGGTRLKMWCRTVGYVRWPYRQVESLKRLRAECKACVSRKDPRVPPDAVAQIDAMLDELMETGGTGFPPHLQKLRCFITKQCSKKRRNGM